MRYNIGAKDTEFCYSQNRKPDNAVLNAATERSNLANFIILPPKQAVFGFNAECYTPDDFKSVVTESLVKTKHKCVHIFSFHAQFK